MKIQIGTFELKSKDFPDDFYLAYHLKFNENDSKKQRKPITWLEKPKTISK